jgi:hypothetical protein
MRRGFGGSYAGVGGNCNPSRFREDPTYGSFGDEFRFEYFDVSLLYNYILGCKRFKFCWFEW